MTIIGKNKYIMSGGSLLIALWWALLGPGPLQAQQVDVFSRPIHYERSHDYDVLHYQIRLTFNLKSQSFWGDTTITLRPLRDDFSVCILDAETFTVSKVEMDANQSAAV